MAQYWASHLANTSEIQPHEDIRKLRLGESITSIWHEFDKKPNGNHFQDSDLLKTDSVRFSTGFWSRDWVKCEGLPPRALETKSRRLPIFWILFPSHR